MISENFPEWNKEVVSLDLECISILVVEERKISKY